MEFPLVDGTPSVMRLPFPWRKCFPWLNILSRSKESLVEFAWVSNGFPRSKGLAWSKGDSGSNRPWSKGLLIGSRYSLLQIKNHFQVGWMGSINNIYNLFWAQEIHNAIYTLFIFINLLLILFFPYLFF